MFNLKNRNRTSDLKNKNLNFNSKFALDVARFCIRAKIENFLNFISTIDYNK